MRNEVRKVLVVVVVCAGLVAVCSAGSGRGTAKENRAKALELLDKFTETVDKAHVSFITKAKCKIFSEHKYSGEWAYLNGQRTRYHLQEFRTDGKRMKHILQQWGDFIGYDGKLFSRPESDKTYRSDTYDGEKRYENNRPGTVFIHTKRPEKSFTIEGMLEYSDHVSKCLGYLRGDHERLDRILKKARTGQISVRDKMEDLNGTAHYVIDAKTNRGQYTVWLNPEKGYNYSKVVVVRGPGDLFRGGFKVESGCQKKYLIENTQFIDVNGVWVPVKAKTRGHDTLPGGNYLKGSKDIELTSILMNPDHDALGSFLVDDIKDGARVVLVGIPGKYIWQNGEVVDENGRKVDLDKLRMKSKKAKN